MKNYWELLTGDDGVGFLSPPSQKVPNKVDSSTSITREAPASCQVLSSAARQGTLPANFNFLRFLHSCHSEGIRKANNKMPIALFLSLEFCISYIFQSNKNATNYFLYLWTASERSPPFPKSENTIFPKDNLY